MDLSVTKLDHEGRGISRYNDKVCFIKKALPNELVSIKILNEKKNYIEAECTCIKEKSDIRINPICPYFDLCGGCNLMHIDYSNQLKYKENKVKEIIEKFTKESIKINEIIGSNELYYRNKITLHVTNKLGLYEEESNSIIEIDKCYIVDNRINEIIERLKKINLDGIYEIVLRYTLNNESMIVFKTSKDIVIKGFDDITSVIIYKDNQYKTIYGKDYIVEKMGDYEFIISPDSFFQVNTKGAINLYDKVLEYVGNSESLLDLYCGTGTIGIYLSKVCKNIIGIEINKYAIKDANENKKLNNIDNIEFMCGDSGKILKNLNKKFDTIVVDPPRSGLDNLAIEQLKKIKSNKIVYVSCNPITLARDLNLLKDLYNIIEITPVDMFPNTSHVECVCVLKLR